MPQYIEPYDRLSSYRGLEGIMEYTNEDGRLPNYNCGQAAVATILAHLRSDLELDQVMPWLEREHPPGNLFGFLGTSRRGVELPFRRLGYRPRIVRGLLGFLRLLEYRQPVILTCQTEFARYWKITIPGGHWMVAFGYDAEYVYLTNCWGNRMTWADFIKGWNGIVPALASLRLACVSVPAPAAPVRVPLGIQFSEAA